MISWRPLHAILVFSLAAATAVTQNQPRPEGPPPAQTPQAGQTAQPAPQEPLPQNANEYIRQAVEHELAEQDSDHSHWRYRYHRDDEKYNYDRDVIETQEGQLARTILWNGQPLTPELQQKDQDRMQRLLSDSAERARHNKREKDDSEKAKNMLKAVPDAFNFQYDGEEDGSVRLTFTPNPRYSAPNRELQVFHSLRGKIWIDRAQKRLARVEGSLFEDVTFGFGLLGRLNKGGTFKVVQQQVAPQHWEVVTLEINMSGHAVIFKTISVRHRQRLSDFERVSDSLTLRQAYEMLQKSPNSVSAGNNTSTTPQSKN